MRSLLIIAGIFLSLTSWGQDDKKPEKKLISGKTTVHTDKLPEKKMHDPSTAKKDKPGTIKGEPKKSIK